MRTCGNIQARPTPRLYTRPRYADPFFNTPAALAVALTGGEMVETVIVAPAQNAGAGYTAAGLTGGLLFDVPPPEVDVTAPPIGAGYATVAMTSGALLDVVVMTDAGQMGAGSLSLSLTGGAVETVVIETTAPQNTANLSVGFTGGALS